MAKASDNPFPSLLLVEQGSAPATPAAGQARLYRGADGLLYVVDDAGTVTAVGGGGGGTLIAPVSLKRAAGDITLSTTGWQNLVGDGSLDLTIAAAAGDVLEYSVSLYANAGANSVVFDGATIVGVNPVNYLAGDGSATSSGIAGLFAQSGEAGGYGASVMYTVQAGDVSAGLVTVRLRARPANTTARIIASSAATQLQIALRNWG